MRITKWIWDGNVIFHEQVERFDDVNFEDCPEIVLFENDILTLKITDKTILIRSDISSDYGIDHIENTEYILTYLPTSDTFSVLEQKMSAAIIEHLDFYIKLQ